MSQSELQQVSPSTIKRGEIPFDLYAMRKGKLVLFCREGFDITDNHAETLANRSQNYFIRSDQWTKYVSYAQNHIKDFIEDQSVDPKVRAKALYSMNKEHFKQMLEDPLNDNVKQQSVDLVDNYVRYVISTPSAVSNLFALASLDVYTYSHSLNVCTMSILMAEVLKPGDREQLTDFGMAGIMHDIGKTKIDDAIITKNGKLTDSEFEQIKLHPVYSDEIIRHHGFSETVREAGRSHHEKVSGGGYPDNLKGSDIPWMGRMLAVVDVYDALTSKRSYKAEMRNVEALKIMHNNMKGAFEPKMFHTLMSIVMKSSSVTARPHVDSKQKVV
jgi:HD-GYP domain-containing protein (c-di-GMP phosphodiesterase class II)